MLDLLLAHTITVLALDSDAIGGWLLTKLVPILFMLLGVGFIISARKGNVSKVATTAGIAIVGVVFIVGAVGIISFSEEITDVVFTAPPQTDVVADVNAGR